MGSKSRSLLDTLGDQLELSDITASVEGLPALVEARVPRRGIWLEGRDESGRHIISEVTAGEGAAEGDHRSQEESESGEHLEFGSKW